MNLTDFLIPPQIQIALKLLPWVLITALVVAFLWQRNALTGAKADAAEVRRVADQALDDNELLATQADQSAIAARALTQQLETIRTRYDDVRNQLASIPPSKCFDGRLPDPAIGLLAYPVRSAPAASSDARKP